MQRRVLFHVAFFFAVCLCAAPSRLAAQVCAQLSGTFATRQAGTTSGAGMEAGTCGGDGAPEKSFLFVAPRSGTYTFDTIGSAFDTVLYLRDGNGAQLACNDDIQGAVNALSRVSVTLSESQSISVFVDGFNGQGGAFVLRVNADCPLPFRNDARDLGNPLSVSLTGTTTCSVSFIGDASCGGSPGLPNGGIAAPDAIFLYSAPADGSYTISTMGSNFDTVLYARLGTCSGSELGCSDDIEPGTNPRSQLNFNLETGQTIVIAVDGYADEKGDYVLSIEGIPFTPTITSTPTQTRSATATPTITMTYTVTPTPSVTNTLPPTAIPTPTRTPTITRTPTVTTTQTPTLTATVTRTWTPTRTYSATPTETVAASVTPTQSATATRSATATATMATATPTHSASPSATIVVVGPGCCQRFLPGAVCEAPISPVGCAQSGGTLVANASCVRGLCVSNDATATSTPTDTPTPIATATPSATPQATATQTLFPTASPTATSQRAIIRLPVGSGPPASILAVNGRVQSNARGVRIFWKVGAELQPLAEGSSASDGSFQVLTAVPGDAVPGDAQVCAAAVGVDARGADMACAPFHVLFAEPGSIVGQVLDAAGLPLAGSDIFVATLRDVPVARTATDTNGEYSLRNLPPDDYVVHVAHAGHFFEALTRQVQSMRTANAVHRATPIASARVYRSGSLALLSPPVFVREPLNSYWLAHFGALPEGHELPVRFFVQVAFVGVEPGPLSLSFLRDGELLFPAAVVTPAPVLDDDTALLGEAYFVDVDVSALPVGDVVLRIARHDVEQNVDIETLDEIHIDIVDLRSRWFSDRVDSPHVGIEADGDRVAYHFAGRLPHPQLEFAFDQILDFGSSTPPLENRVSLQANIVESYFTDDTWRGRVSGSEDVHLLGVDVVGAAVQLPFVGPTGEQFAAGEYALDRRAPTVHDSCPLLPAASAIRPTVFNGCKAGCPFTAQARPAVATCAALTSRSLATVGRDLALTVSVASDNARRRGERTALDQPMCRGFVDSEAEQALHVGVRYEPDRGLCPQECSFFEDLCVDLSAPALSQVRCLSKTVDAENILLQGVRVGCEGQLLRRGAASIDPEANRPKAVATDGAGHAMLVWVDDVTAPAALLFSYFDGESWSAARPLADSGFIDSPQVAFLAADRAIAVWEQSRLGHEAAAIASLQELLASTELYAAEWNGETWSLPVAITNDDVADAHPSLAAAPATTSALVAWTRANPNPSQPQLVVAYSFFNGTWSAPARVVADSISLDYGPSVAFDAMGRAAMVFTRDLDRNAATVTDRSLVYSSFGGSRWSTPEGFGPGYTPTLAFSASHEPVVAFVRPAQEAGPVTQATGEGNRSQLYVARRRQGNWSAAPIGARVFAEHPVVRVNRDNDALVVFRHFDAPSAQGVATHLSLATASLTAAAPIWSHDAIGLSSHWLPVFDLHREGGVAVIAATQHASGVSGVSVGDGSIEAAVLAHEAALAVRLVEPSDPHPLLGDVVDLVIEIVNRGLAPLPAEQVVEVLVNGDNVGSFPLASGLRFGASARATVTYQIARGGLQHLLLRTDSGVLGERVFGFPPEPANLTAFLSPASLRPELSWEMPGRGIGSYRIYRDHASGVPGAFGELIGETAGLRFMDATAGGGDTRRYAVHSVDEDGVVSLAAALITLPAASAACLGDCDGDGLVTIDEAVTVVAIAAGMRPATDCLSLGGSDAASIDAALSTVERALGGCL